MSKNQQKGFVCPVVTFLAKNILTVLFLKFIDDITLFMVGINETLWFGIFHYRFNVISLSENPIKAELILGQD